MPLIRRWADVETVYPDGLTPAEDKLIAACKAGEDCQLEDGELPPEGAPKPNREVRADLLRYLILGGCEECEVNGWGVRLTGAHVTGELDLSFTRAKGITRLVRCRFDEKLVARQSCFELLNLSGSALIGLIAHGAEVNGDVFLRRVTAKESVGLSGATIGGQLDCEGAGFNATEGAALIAQGAQVAEDVFLRQITASATVDLKGATIDGQLSCSGAKFGATKEKALDLQGVRVTGSVFLRKIEAIVKVDVNSAIIDGHLDCTDASFSAKEGDAFHAQRLKVVQGLVWRKVAVASGWVDLASAQAGDLVDDLASWPTKGRLYLDGFTYDRIGGASTDAHSRIAWLEQGTTWSGEFFPQPFTQLAKVLHEMGHEGDARKVLFHREKLLGWHARQRALKERGARARLRNRLWHPVRVIWDRALRYVAGYGYAPLRSFWSLILLIAFATFPAHWAWEEGSFAPNAGPVLVSEDWQGFAKTEAIPAAVWAGDALPARLRDTEPDTPLADWKAVAPGRDWETFNRYAWAADLVIPIIDLGQTDAWAPSTTRGDWGKHLYWLRWLFILLGWLVTALGAAAITGLIRQE